MNIKRLYIDGYKNLKDFETIFIDEASLNLIYGKNGSGKSNYFEAISAIFDDLFRRTELLDRYRGLYGEIDEKIKSLQFSYQIEFVNKDTLVNIKYNHINIGDNSDFKSATEHFDISIDNAKSEFKILGKYLPRNIFGYYSGETSRLKKYFRKNTNEYSRNLRNSVLDNDFARLVFVNEQVLDYIMITLRVFSEELYTDAEFISKAANGISGVVLKFNSPNLKENDYYHGLEGDLLRTLELISECGRNNVGRKGQLSSIVISEENEFSKLKDLLNEEYISMRLFFENLMNLKYSGIVKSIDVNISLDQKFDLFSLSEGEKQLLTIIGMLTIQKDSDCIFLLDEPDAFLYPQWQRELTEQINNIDVDGQILLSTHSPLSIGEVMRENVLLFENGNALNPPINTFGTTSEAVLEVVMGVEERNSRFNDLIEKFDDSVTIKNISRCREIVSSLKELGLPSDDIFFLEAEAEIVRLEVLLEENN